MHGNNRLLKKEVIMPRPIHCVSCNLHALPQVTIVRLYQGKLTLILKISGLVKVCQTTNLQYKC